MTKLADRLRKDSLLNHYQIEYAEQWSERAALPLLEAVVGLKLVNETAMLRYLSTARKTKYVTTEKLNRIRINSSVLGKVPVQTAREHCICPVVLDPEARTLTIVSRAPYADEAFEMITALNPDLRFLVYVAPPSSIKALVRKHYENDIDAFSGIGDRVNRDIEEFLKDYAGQADLSELPDAGEPVITRFGKEPQPVRDGGGFEALIKTIPPLSSPPSPHSPGGLISVPPVKALEDFSKYVPEEPVKPAWSGFLPLLEVFASLLEQREGGVKGHGAGVTRLATHMAERLGMGRDEVTAIAIAGCLHEAGRTPGPHRTLLSAESLKSDEAAARESCSITARLFSGTGVPEAALDAISHLYERYDGTGFPDGLRGEAIPVASRILTVADSFKDLADNPSNFKGRVLDPLEALDAIRPHSGRLFDPRVVELLSQSVQTEEVRKKLLDASPRVLIADHNLDDAAVLELKLSQRGYNVRHCREGLSARAAIETGEFDVVIAELNLPEANGFTLLETARRPAGGPGIPFILFTEAVDPDVIQKAFELGVTDYIAKPVSPDIVAAKVRKYLEEPSTKAHRRKGVSGSLSDMGLPDILQLLSQARKSGLLAIKSLGREGEIYLDQGKVVEAILGEARGEKAFFGMLEWQDGEFILDPDSMISVGSINTGVEALLMEGLRRLDESRRGEK